MSDTNTDLHAKNKQLYQKSTSYQIWTNTFDPELWAVVIVMLA